VAGLIPKESKAGKGQREILVINEFGMKQRKRDEINERYPESKI
jgi:hypothetical protein